MNPSNAEPDATLPAAATPVKAAVPHRAEHPTVTLKSAGTLVASIPLFFGFQPEDSMVILGLSSLSVAVQPIRIVCGFRFDLDDIGRGSTLVDDVLQGLRRHHAEQVILIAFGPRPAAARGADPEGRRAAVTDLGARLSETGRLRVADAMYTENGRWWSYLCPDACCWPEAGSPVPTEAPPALLTAPQFRNTVVADSRHELEQTLQPYASDQTSAIATTLKATRTGPDGRFDVETVRQLADAALQRCHTDSVEIDDDECAALLDALRHHTVRDYLACTAGDQDGASRLQVLATELARRAPADEYRPAPYALAALAAWALGRTAIARSAVARALAVDPGYTFATLISSGLSHGIEPASVREFAAQTHRDLDAEPAAPDVASTTCARPASPRHQPHPHVA